jgi:hypothetical protein
VIPERVDGGIRGDPPALSRFALTSHHEGLMYRTFNRSPEIEVLDSTKTVVRRLRLDLPPAVVSPEIRQRWKEQQIKFLRSHYGPNSRFEQNIEDTRFADSTSYFFRIVLGNDGSTWVMRYDPVPDSVSSYFVFSKQGRHVGTLTMPTTMVLHRADAEVAVVTMADEDDNTLVKVVPIRRSRSAIGR